MSRRAPEAPYVDMAANKKRDSTGRMGDDRRKRGLTGCPEDLEGDDDKDSYGRDDDDSDGDDHLEDQLAEEFLLDEHGSPRKHLVKSARCR